MLLLKLLFTFAALLVALASANAQTVSLSANPAQLWKVENGALQAAPDNVVRWRVNTGQSGALALANPVLGEIKEYDLFNFEWRIVSGEISQLELYVLGNATGPRRTKIHNWTLGLMTTPQGEWQSENLELARPGWFPWDKDDGTKTAKFFRLETLALAPDTVVEIRNARLSRAVVRLKPDFIAPISWPIKTTDENGNVTYQTTYQVQNASGAPTDLEAEVLSKHAKFKVAFEQTKVRVNASDATDFVLTATISAADIAATPELYSEPLRLRFYATGQPAAAWQWDGFLTRPLAPDLKRQVIAAPATLELLREKVKAGDVAALKTLDYARIIARADELAGVELQQIPGSHSHPRNRLPAAKIGAFMPEIINTATGKREVGTALADQFWKEYLGYGGATEALGLAYLLTGDEKYAQQAAKLFELYGRHYARLDWYSGFEAKWSDGPAILASSRVASSSTYGSNWFFKEPLKMLSMIAESEGWQKADRDAIYRGFALPYATELMKFPAGVNNMTDVTNANILLLGLVFDDANMVRWALQRDSGLLARLGDLDDDGFSSEGRPVNYHLAAMDEYLTSLVYLENSGLKLDIPKERLLKALRMPFSRATLTGAIPMTGDMGRGYRLRNTKLADEMFALFPDQKWLFEIGDQSNLTTQAHALKTGETPDKEGWKSLLETTPRLYRNAGFAILRSGDTPQSQIMATLDWGRNPVHGAFDRNQFTLSAFGKAFSAGPGSLYNAGKGGATFGDDPDLKALVGYSTLAHNLITVDGQDQLPSVGKLLKWDESPTRQLAVSRVENIAPGVAHTRGVMLTDGIIVLLDRIESDEEHLYDWIYHNFGELQLGDGWTAKTQNEPLGQSRVYRGIVAPQKLSGQGMVRAQWDLTGQFSERRKETATPTFLNLWHDGPHGQIYSGQTGLNNTNTMILPDAVPTLIHRVRAKNADFFSVLEPTTGASKIKSVTRANGALQIELTKGQTIRASLDAWLE